MVRKRRMKKRRTRRSSVKHDKEKKEGVKVRRGSRKCRKETIPCLAMGIFFFYLIVLFEILYIKT